MVNCCLIPNAWWIDHRQKKFKPHRVYIYQKLNQNKISHQRNELASQGADDQYYPSYSSVNKWEKKRTMLIIAVSHSVIGARCCRKAAHLRTTFCFWRAWCRTWFKICFTTEKKKRLLVILVVILIIILILIITLTLVEEVHHGWPSLVETGGRQLVAPVRQLGCQQLRHEEGWEVRVRGQALELGLGFECWYWRVQPQKHWRPKGPAVLTAWATVDVAAVEPSFVPAFVHVWCIQSHF